MAAAADMHLPHTIKPNSSKASKHCRSVIQRTAMQFCATLCAASLVLLNCAPTQSNPAPPEAQVIRRVLAECLPSPERFSCLAERAAGGLEHFMDFDVALSNDILLIRNNETFNSTGRALGGFDKLSNVFVNFLRTHTFSMDLYDFDQEARGLRDGGGGGDHGGGGGGHGGQGGGYGGSMNKIKKIMKKEGEYFKYTMKVLLGIFSLTGPIMMKVLAIMAGKAVLASKAALLIAGGVALSNMFENSHASEKTSIKVHTVHDNHDRYDYKGNMYYSKDYPYSASEYY